MIYDILYIIYIAFDNTLYFYAAESRLKYFLGPMQARLILYMMYDI